MKIKIMSDLHMEFWKDSTALHELYAECKDTVLVIAGDLHIGDNALKVLAKLNKYYYYVVYVPGNHEYYGRHVEKLEERLSACTLEGLHILNPGHVVIDNVDFIGATLWTDLANGDIDAMDYARENLNDFYLIKYNKKLLTTFRYRKLHQRDLAYLDIKLSQIDGRTAVVVTHHLPSYRCVSPEHAGSKLNPAFVSNLDWLIEKHAPKIWIHGHTHKSLDFMIESTRIICNPFGYAGGGENREFNPRLIVDI